MNKKDLVDAIAEKLGTQKKETEKFLNSFIDVVSNSLEKEEEIKIMGFGTFKVQQRAEREGVNPQTKERITIPATKVPKFSAGKELKERVK